MVTRQVALSGRVGEIWVFLFLALYAVGVALGGAGAGPAQAAARQTTGSAYVELGVSDLSAAADTVRWLVSRYGGQIEDDYQWTEGERHRASLTLLVPVSQFAGFHRALGSAGVVQDERLTAAPGNAYVTHTRVTVLLVAPYPPPPPPTPLPVAPQWITPRAIAAAPPASRAEVILRVAVSLVRGLVVVALALLNTAGPLLLFIVGTLWLLWAARRRAPSEKSPKE